MGAWSMSGPDSLTASPTSTHEACEIIKRALDGAAGTYVVHGYPLLPLQAAIDALGQLTFLTRRHGGLEWDRDHDLSSGEGAVSHTIGGGSGDEERGATAPTPAPNLLEARNRLVAWINHAEGSTLTPAAVCDVGDDLQAVFDELDALVVWQTRAMAAEQELAHAWEEWNAMDAQVRAAATTITRAERLVDDVRRIQENVGLLVGGPVDDLERLILTLRAELRQAAHNGIKDGDPS